MHSSLPFTLIGNVFMCSVGLNTNRRGIFQHVSNMSAKRLKSTELQSNRICTSRREFSFFVHAMRLPCYKELKIALKKKNSCFFFYRSSSGTPHIHISPILVCLTNTCFFQNFPTGQMFCDVGDMSTTFPTKPSTICKYNSNQACKTITKTLQYSLQSPN